MTNNDKYVSTILKEEIMKLKDLLDKISFGGMDTYIDIREFRKMTFTGRRYIIKERKDCENIPEDVLNNEVVFIKPYKDIFVIEIKP